MESDCPGLRVPAPPLLSCENVGNSVCVFSSPKWRILVSRVTVAVNKDDVCHSAPHGAYMCESCLWQVQGQQNEVGKGLGRGKGAGVF